MIRQWSHTRQKGWGYPPKKTACQSGLRFQRYESLKSVTTAGRPLILRFLVYISRNSLRASRSLVIRLGSESCDQISASPNGPKRAKSRDKTAGSLFTRVYTLVEFSQTKRCFFSFLKQNIQRQMIHQHHYRLHNTIHISLKQDNYFILLVFLLILLAIDKCNRASSLAISVSQHCERAFRTPIICLYAPYMKRRSLRRVAGQSSYVARARLPTSERETEGILRVPLYWRE